MEILFKLRFFYKNKVQINTNIIKCYNKFCGILLNECIKLKLHLINLKMAMKICVASQNCKIKYTNLVNLNYFKMN